MISPSVPLHKKFKYVCVQFCTGVRKGAASQLLGIADKVRYFALLDFYEYESHLSDGREKFLWAAHCLATNPVLDSLLAGFNDEEEELVRQLVDYQGEDWLQSLQEEQDVSKRYLKVAQSLGLTWEASLWGLLENLNSGQPVKEGHLVHASSKVFRARQEEKCKLQLSRAVERADRVMVTAQLICLGEAEPAVGLLLDSDPGEENYMADQLLACLIQVPIKNVCHQTCHYIAKQLTDQKLYYPSTSGDSSHPS